MKKLKLYYLLHEIFIKNYASIDETSTVKLKKDTSENNMYVRQYINISF